MSPAPKVALAQTEITIPHSPNAKAELSDADKLALYEREKGYEALARQQAEWRRQHECNCGGTGAKGRSSHKVGCPKAK